MKFLEKLLDIKCKEENTEVYLSQWIYDKEIYSDILNNVKDYYSNYTDHGKKHSDTILNNIVRIFEPNDLEALSSFDIWLLLEAAYMHDCGMYISLEKAKDVLRTKEFKRYLLNIKNQEWHPLLEYSKNFIIDKEINEISYQNMRYSPEDEYGMRFIIASYMRASHAKNAGDLFKERTVNYIIPQRIYKILSTIVEAHNFDFKDVLKIPQKETGIGQESGHPRFIACLLRIGDLLDIDNNRISPTILNNLKNIIPDESMEHIKKHRSIVHYRVDSKKIEITSKIENNIDEVDNIYNIADITNQWFKFIEEEFNNQLLIWDEIRPCQFTAHLPLLGELIVELEGYDYINSKEKPQFSVDINNILGLLSGGGIYKNKEVAMREIIQNAIDATLLRTYKENELKYLNNCFTLDKRLDLFKGKEIQININKQTSDDVYNYWMITVVDKGIGISKDNLKYLIKAGSSYKDNKKYETIEKMPQWMTPSGNFGIGFQSIFLLTDKITIESKSLYTNESIEATLFSPKSAIRNRGNIFIKTLSFDYKKEIGTKINFIYKTIKNASSYSSSYQDKFLNNFLDNFDPFLEKEFDIDIIKLMDEIEKVNSFSLIDIKMNKNDNPIELKKMTKTNLNIKYYDEYKIGIYIPKRMDDITNWRKNKRIFYKNQELESKNSYTIKYLKVLINIVGYKASEVLEVSRNELKNNFWKENYTNIIFGMIKYIKEELELDFQELDSSLKVDISLFLRKYRRYYDLYIKKNEKICAKILDFYKEYKPSDEYISFEDLNELTQIKLTKSYSDQGKDIKIEGKNVICDSEDILNWLCEENKYIMKYKMSEKKSRYVDEEFDLFLEKVNIANEEYINISNDEIVMRLKKYKINKRSYIPFNNKYKNLKLSNNLNFLENENYSWINNLYFGISELDFSPLYERNRILFPFFITWKNGEAKYTWNDEIRKKYIDFQFDNREDKKLSIEDVIKDVNRLVDDFKVLLNE